MSYQPQKGRIAEEPLKDHPEYRWRRKLGKFFVRHMCTLLAAEPLQAPACSLMVTFVR